LRVRVESVLNVALSYNSEVTNDIDGSGSKHVVVGVGKGLRRSDDNRISGVNTERIKVLYPFEARQLCTFTGNRSEK
jgi:hypothetical protein